MLTHQKGVSMTAKKTTTISKKPTKNGSKSSKATSSPKR